MQRQRQQQRGVALRSLFLPGYSKWVWLRSSVWSVIVFRHFNLITAFKLSLCAHQRNNNHDQNRTEQNIIFKFVMINLLIVCSSFENRHQSDCVFPSGSPFVGSSMKRLLLPNQRKAIRHKNHHHCFDFSIPEQKAFLHCLWWWMKGRSSSYTMECKAVSSNVMCCISPGPMNWSTSIAVDMSGLLLLLLLLPLLLSSVTILKRVVASQPLGSQKLLNNSIILCSFPFNLLLAKSWCNSASHFK